MNRKRLLSFIVFLEIAFASFLFIKIYESNKILGISVIRMNKESIYYNPFSKFKYFFEPVPNTVEDSPKWIKWAKARYIINADSLNERFNYSVNRAPNTFRIITIGDSYTFGLFVDTKYNWSEILEDLLNENLSCKNIKKIEVLNLGEFGYDIEYAIERYRIRGVKYDPDLVIWLLKDDDFFEINEIMREKEQLIPLREWNGLTPRDE